MEVIGNSLVSCFMVAMSVANSGGYVIPRQWGASTATTGNTRSGVMARDSVRKYS